MSNPWLKKNPFLSMWLSGANAMLGTARSAAAAQLQRQTRTASAEMLKAVIPAATPAAKRRRAVKSRKRR